MRCLKNTCLNLKYWPCCLIHKNLNKSRLVRLLESAVYTRAVNTERYEKKRNLVPVSWKSRERFEPVKPFIVHLYLKAEVSTGVYEEVQRCMKGTSGYIKNAGIKQLCNHKVWDFAKALRGQKRFVTFAKQGPGHKILLGTVFIAYLHFSY